MSSRPGVRAPSCAAVLVLAFLLGTVASDVAGQDLNQAERQRMYQQVKPAVVLVQTEITAQIQIDLGNEVLEGEEQMNASGSGWIISPNGYLVTNGHVVDQYHDRNEERLKQELLFQFIRTRFVPQLERAYGREITFDELVAIIPELLQRSQVALMKNLQVVLQNGDRYAAEVKQFSPGMSMLPGRVSFPGGEFAAGKDVAILKIEGRDLPTVAIGNSDQLSLGDDIYVAGYPGVVASHPFLSERTQMEPSFTRGSVSSVKLAVGGAEVMQMDASTTWGNSGGPVFNGRGEVVGMTTFGSIAPREDGSMQVIQGFNFAVPTSTIMEFVRAEGVAPSAGLFNRTWTTALDAYHAGRWTAAVDAMDEVLRVHAGLPDAIRLRSIAVSQRGTETGTPWVMVSLVAAGMMLVGTGLVMRRRTAPQTAAVGGAVTPTARRTPVLAGTSGRKALPARSRLVVVEGPLRGNRFDITEAGVKIGRDPASCQVVLSESASSREHAVVLPTAPGEAVICNLSGTNPTFVNGRPVQEAALTAGDRIRIAGSVLTFESE